MNRRDFLRTLLASSACFGSGLVPRFAQADLPPNDQRVLLNLFLRGGPDIRHLIAPPFDSTPGTYGYAYWSNRWRVHGIENDASAWQARWQDDYFHVELDGVEFGVLKVADWLRDRIEAGHVALLNNVVGATSRDHSHASVVWEAGDRAAMPGQLARDGWGGRLARAVDGHVVSMTPAVRQFCNGPHATDPLRHDNRDVVSVRDSRDFSLFRAPALASDPAAEDGQSIMSRALQSYYAGKAADVPEDSLYRPFVQHEQNLRALGALVDSRLAEVPLPPAIQALYDGDGTLESRSFGRQIRNAYDAFACSDLFDLRAASLVYDGFDSHAAQRETIEPKFASIFGGSGGLATLQAELQDAMPSAWSNSVLLVAGEFGRQLKDNGDQGTDHGRGNTVLLIGEQVRSGVYGDLFPASEIPRYGEVGLDIEGQTAIERVFSRISDWVEPGAGDTVFGDVSAAPIEDGVSLENLLA